MQENWSDLVDEASVLHAVVEGVSGQAGSHWDEGGGTAEESSQYQNLPQARVTRHAGHSLSQRGQTLQFVQHAWEQINVVNSTHTQHHRLQVFDTIRRARNPHQWDKVSKIFINSHI